MKQRRLFGSLIIFVLTVALAAMYVAATSAASPSAGPASEYQLSGGPDLDRAPFKDRVAPVSYQELHPRAETVQVWLELAGEPLAVWLNDGRSKVSATQEVYMNQLAVQQTAVAAHAQNLGATVLAGMRHLVNVLAVEAPVHSLGDLAAIPGVVGVYPIQEAQIDLTNSVPWIGAMRAQEDFGYDGSGVTVAIIDSGVDYTHAAFSGPGTELAYTIATTGTNATVITDTIAGWKWPEDSPKVVGGYDFVGSNWAESSDPLEPDPDPVDDGPGAGHGTNVASNAAGLLVTETVTSDVLVGQGVAPGADIYAYKVCSSISTSCSGIAMVQAMERATFTDTVDVINMSIGAIYGGAYEDYVTTQAAQNAADNGVLVAVSAGNSSNRPYITGAPGVADGVLSTAASYANNQMGVGLQVNEPISIAATYLGADFGWAPDPTEMITALVVFVGSGCDVADYPQGLIVTDTIALIERGDCRFDEKVFNAEQKGAVAAVLYNNVPGEGPFSGGGSPIVTIPAFMIGNEDGVLIRDTIAIIDVEGTIGPDITFPLPELADAIADFSSRGPRIWDNKIKPDITAPGPGVYSAAVGSGNKASLFGGTSSAAPHIAGSLALLREKYPGWSVLDIYNALMNTAHTELYTQESGGNPNYGGTGVRAAVTRQGAGRVQVDDALQTATLAWDDDYDKASLSYGYHAITETWVMTKTVRVLNLMSGPSGAYRTYEISHTNVFTDDENVGVTVELSTDVLTVPMGTSATFDVGLWVDAAGLKEWTLNGGSHGDDGGQLTDLEFDGYVTISEVLSIGAMVIPTDVVNLPFHLLPHKAAEVKADQSMLMMDAYTDTAALTLTNGAAYTGTADIYAWMVDDPLGDVVHGVITPTPNLDIDHIGVRTFVDVNFGPMFEFSIVAAGPRAHPILAEFAVNIDVDNDSATDYILFNGDFGDVPGLSSLQGQNYTFLYDVAADAVFFEFYTDTDLNSKNMRLYLPAADIGLGANDLSISFFVEAWDYYMEIPGVDYAPDLGWVAFDGNNPKFFPDSWFPTVVGSRGLTVFGWQDGAIKSPEQMGLLLLYRNQDPVLEAEGVKVTVAAGAGASTSPVDRRIDVRATEEIPVYFSDAVSATTVTFAVSPTVPISVTWPATDTAHVVPTAPFALGEMYELRHNGGAGPGVTYPPNSWTFKVEKQDLMMPLVFKNVP
jgi:minor extracellular serine protease Vpr